MSPIHVNRRRFLKTTAALGAGWSGVVRAMDSRSPNDRVNLAFVGTQNQASFSIKNCAGENIVAICDVDRSYLDARGATLPKARRYRDFRKMLEAEQGKIDAVVVATPDHIHAPAAAMALRLGKHVYCEKPLAHSVAEARLLAELAAKNKLATQMGTQIHAEANYRRVVELIQSGAIGSVTQAHAWCGKGWADGRFSAPKNPPKNLDWDLWLGPASTRAFSEGLHPADWRRFWEFGSGTLGDMGCHVLDLAFWALKLRHPTKVVASGPKVDRVGAPAWVQAEWRFPARESSPPVLLTWSDGEKRPAVLGRIKEEGGPDLRQWGLGVVFVGDKGMLAADYGRLLLLPADKFKDFQPPPHSIADSVGHHREWLQACRSGSGTTCNFDYSGAVTETVLLGTVAYRTGRRLEWDAVNLRAVNCPAAEQFVHKEYRSGWSPFA